MNTWKRTRWSWISCRSHSLSLSLSLSLTRSLSSTGHTNKVDAGNGPQGKPADALEFDMSPMLLHFCFQRKTSTGGQGDIRGYPLAGGSRGYTRRRDRERDRETEDCIHLLRVSCESGGREGDTLNTRSAFMHLDAMHPKPPSLL
ncbi:hypothetical protein T484DRAFT_2942819 [Baffinella frigidus]|nr:hypothetical protein T484DRAFT_2942819 [Cryptophyta sp. CCMP2293]